MNKMKHDINYSMKGYSLDNPGMEKINVRPFPSEETFDGR